MYRTAKISFLLLSFISIPLLVNCELVLKVWLKNVPEYTVVFVKLTIFVSLVAAWNGPLWMSVQATGKIKKNQIVVSSLIFMNLPLSFLVLKYFTHPEYVLVIRLIIAVVAIIWRVFYLSGMVGLSKKEFFLNVMFRTLFVFLLCYFLTSFAGSFIKNPLLFFFTTCIISVILVTVASVVFCLTGEEKKYFKEILVKLKERKANDIKQ